ncbi:GumC family protein [Microvirga rosea]|uniref:GumC family protein n=1 Tax=Microvirga rosea TaxID=2715425 RepID=UPI001D0ABB25|nr:lipopolysaccharide biosynthesis protein [Microvirga rosea]MCB8818932.1 lipopolysaccharide biosynthesis protein [Microvirga rosea]
MNNVDFRFYASLFLRRIHYFIVVVVVISGVGITIARLLPPTYQANAKILVESPQISTDLVRSTVPAEILKQIQTVELQMTTRANLIALADRLGLYRDIPNISESDVADDIRSRMSVEQIQFDTPRGRDAALAFNVSYKARDPVSAANIVNEFVKLLIQKNMQLRAVQAGETLEFFQQETEKLSKKLIEIESQISNFKRENREALPDGLGFRYNQQLSLQERLMQLSREETSLRDGRARLLQAYENADRASNDAASTPEQQTLDHLRKTLAEQRTIFSDKSPAITALQTQIAALEKLTKDMREKSAKARDGKTIPPELDLQLTDFDRRLSLIADDKAAAESTLSNLNKAIAATPGNEAALSAMERQYQSVQSQYNAATSRLAEASTGDRIEQRSKGERLSVLDYAMPPQYPIGPKRLAIAVASVLASILAGFGLILVLELMNKTIRRPSELVARLEIEPLETIPFIPSKDEAHSTRLKLVPGMIRRAAGV